MRKERNQEFFRGVVLCICDIPIHAHTDGSDHKHDVTEMEIALAVPYSYPKTAPDWGTEFGITLVEVGLL